MTDNLLLVDGLAVLRLCLHLQRGILIREVIILRAVERVPIVMLSYPGWIFASTVLLVNCRQRTSKKRISKIFTEIKKLRDSFVSSAHLPFVSFMVGEPSETVVRPLQVGSPD